MRGSLQLRKGTRDVWELRVNQGTDNQGVRHVKTRTFRGGKRDAQRELAAFVTEVVEGRHVRGTTTTMAALLASYLEHIKPNKSPSTMRGYQRRVEHQIIPALGKVRVARLTTYDIDVYMRERLADHKPSDVRQDYAIIRGALGLAVKWDMVSKNVALNAEPPKVQHHEIRPPTPTVMLSIIQAAEEGTGHANSRGNADLACFLRLLTASGARRGEVCALQLGDFDPLAGTVMIVRNIVEQGNKRPMVVKEPKSDNGRRKVNLDDVTLDSLRAHVARLHATARAADVELGPESWLFTSDLEHPWRPDYVSLAFRRLTERVGVKCRLHDLRHAQATYLLAGGMPIRDVAGRLGQDPATTMRTYAARLEQGDKAAALLVGRLLAIGAGAEPAATGTAPPAG